MGEIKGEMCQWAETIRDTVRIKEGQRVGKAEWEEARGQRKKNIYLVHMLVAVYQWHSQPLTAQETAC